MIIWHQLKECRLTGKRPSGKRSSEKFSL